MITIECNYSKKLGLPQYSSHQFGITPRAELTSLDDVQAQSARLYLLLQQSVDLSLRQTGFLPSNNGNGQPPTGVPQNGHRQQLAGPQAWACSERQRSLILRIAQETGLPEDQLEALAQRQFGKPPPELTKPEASGFISQLLSQPTGSVNGNRG